MIIILCIIARGWLLSGRWTRLGNANREMLSTNANWSFKYLISLHIDIIFFLYGNIIHSKWICVFPISVFSFFSDILGFIAFATQIARCKNVRNANFVTYIICMCWWKVYVFYCHWEFFAYFGRLLATRALKSFF